MHTIDLSPLLKVAARLLDLHDSRRATGESPQYQTEERPGLGDGQYVAIAQAVLEVLQGLGTNSGNAYSTLALIQQEVRGQLEWAADVDIEYVLNVLSRPTELKLLHTEEGEPSHVIGDKDTALVEKAAHVVEFRLSRLGKTALAMASDNTDIAYIEGDVTKLIRALDAGRLASALGFTERLLMQLRSEQLALVALIERTAGGRKSREDAISDLEFHRDTMRRAAELVDEARLRVESLMRREVPTEDDVPIGLVKAKIKELSAGVVRYGRELTRLAELSMHSAPSSVQAPSFRDLAQQWVKAPLQEAQLDRLLATLGAAPTPGLLPTGTDFAGLVRARVQQAPPAQSIALEGFEVPVEDRFLEWLRRHRPALEERLQSGGIDLHEALSEGLGHMDDNAALNCLVTALTAPDEWLELPVTAEIDDALARFHLPGIEVLASRLTLKRTNKNDGEES